MGATEPGVIGQSVRRKEGLRFLTGAGQYTDDVNFAHQTCGYFLRSPHAHAKIRKIDLIKAKAVIPMHYLTNPALPGTPEQFSKALGGSSGGAGRAWPRGRRPGLL